MELYEIFIGVIVGGPINFMLAIALEQPVLRKIQKIKFGNDSDQKLSKKEGRQLFFIPLTFISISLGIFLVFVGGQYYLLPTS